MTMLPRKMGVIALGALMGLSVSVVTAQADDGYSAKGLPLGAFRLFPVIDVRGEYNDNVYAQSTNEVEDLLVIISPGAVLASNWGRHELNIHTSADIVRHDERQSEDRISWNVGLDGRLDASRDISLSVTADYSSLRENRGEPDVLLGFAEPPRYKLAEVGGELSYHPGRFEVALGAEFQDYDFKGVPLVGGGAFSNDDRDRNVTSVYAELAYEFSPGYAAFVRGGYNMHNFDSAVDRFGFNRESDGYTIDGGLEVQLTNLVSGRVFIGYLDQDYDSPFLSDVTGLNYGAEIDWNVTPLLHVGIVASRELRDTTAFAGSTSDNNIVGVDVDYELLRNIIAHANFEYTKRRFPGIARKDSVYDLGVGLQYLLNRYASVGAEYSYTTQDSNLALQEFDRNLVALYLRLQM